METIEQDRLIAAKRMHRRNLIGAGAAFFAFVPLPLFLLGNPIWACMSIGAFALYVILEPSFCAPTRAEVNDSMRDESIYRSRPVYLNGQYQGSMVITDPAGQAASDAQYTQLIHGDSTDGVFSPDGELYAQMHSFQQMHH